MIDSTSAATNQMMDDRFRSFGQNFQSKLEVHASALDARLGQMEVRLTWRMIAVVVFLGTVMTLVGAHIE